MENEKIKNGIKEIKKIEMTYSEKRIVFDNLLSLIEAKKENKTNLNYGSIYSFFFSSPGRRLVYYVLIPLTIILSGGGVAFASQDSLPGDFLYPVKTKIIEPVGAALSFTSEAKTKHESRLISRRLEEAETLAKKGKLDAEKEQKINKLLEKHTVSLGKSIEKVDKDNNKKDIKETIENLNKDINTKVKNINEITNKQKTNFKKQNDDNSVTQKSPTKAKEEKGSSLENKNNKQINIKDKEKPTPKKNNP